jgi:hypothetical protein
MFDSSRFIHRAASFWRTALGAILALVLAATLSACGGSGGSSAPPPSEGHATIGTAGGTVTGPDGVTVVVPAGALSADTTLRIARDATGAPEVGGLRLVTPIYQLTPHGIEFESPVRIRIPFDQSQLRSSTPPVIVRFQPGNDQWEILRTDIEDGVAAADSSGFSYYAIGECFIEQDYTVPGPGPIAQCPADVSLKLTLRDSNQVVLPQPRNASGILLPAMTITTPTQIGIDIEYRRPMSPVADTVYLHSTGGQPPSLNASFTAAANTASLFVNRSSVTIDPAQITGASLPGGKNYRIWSNVTRTFDAFYPGCLCWRPTSWTFSADLLLKVVYHTAPTAPSITTQPADRTVAVGANATFLVAASGTAPLSYQWYRDGMAIPGANGASYTLTNAQLADSGAQFYVVVSNSEGSVTSNTVTLTVNPAPSGACGVPQLIESGSGSAYEPRVLLDSSGNATAVWIQDSGGRYRVFANRYTASRGWGTEQTIDPTLSSAGGAVIGQDSAGNLLAVWQGGGSVYANHYTASSGWGNSVDWFDGTGSNPSSAPALAMAASGTGVAVWIRYDGTTDSIYARQYTGSGWGPAQVISDGFYRIASPDVAIGPDVAINDANGHAMAVWPQSTGSTHRPYYNVFNGTAWGTAQPIASSSVNVVRIRVAMNANGQAVAIWVQNDGGAYAVYAAIYTPGSGWSAPTTLDPGTSDRTEPFVTIDSSGKAIAVWKQWDGTRHRIYARRYAQGGGWTPITQLAEPGLGDAWEPSIAMDPSGNAVVTWMQWIGGGFGIFGNRYTPSSGWAGPVLLAEATNDVATPRVALNASGTAMVVWREGEGSATNPSIKALRWCP